MRKNEGYPTVANRREFIERGMKLGLGGAAVSLAASLTFPISARAADADANLSVIGPVARKYVDDFQLAKTIVSSA